MRQMIHSKGTGSKEMSNTQENIPQTQRTMLHREKVFTVRKIPFFFLFYMLNTNVSTLMSIALFAKISNLAL